MAGRGTGEGSDGLFAERLVRAGVRDVVAVEAVTGGLAAVAGIARRRDGSAVAGSRPSPPHPRRPVGRGRAVLGGEDAGPVGSGLCSGVESSRKRAEWRAVLGEEDCRKRAGWWAVLGEKDCRKRGVVGRARGRRAAGSARGGVRFGGSTCRVPARSPRGGLTRVGFSVV